MNSSKFNTDIHAFLLAMHELAELISKLPLQGPFLSNPGLSVPVTSIRLQQPRSITSPHVSAIAEPQPPSSSTNPFLDATIMQQINKLPLLRGLPLDPSLPPDVTNIFPPLLAIIPGPKNPCVKQLTQFLGPLARHLHDDYHGGAPLSISPDWQKGRVQRSVMDVTVQDFLAPRIFQGQFSRICDAFLCTFLEFHGKDINNFDWSSWRPRGVADLRRVAEEWRDPRSQSRRNKLFQTNGVQWSPFNLRLEDVLDIGKSEVEDEIVSPQVLAANTSSHYAALHIGECHFRFGTMQGQWMFPLERAMYYRLQK